jgi:hypothetical protein
MMETIERVARLLRDLYEAEHDYTYLTPEQWEFWVRHAKVVIDAMQEDIAEADRKAREECAAICENMTEAYSIADDCADVIRSTITPASRQHHARTTRRARNRLNVASRIMK